jgi:hypothetical protein
LNFSGDKRVRERLPSLETKPTSRRKFFPLSPQRNQIGEEPYFFRRKLLVSRIERMNLLAKNGCSVNVLQPYRHYSSAALNVYLSEELQTRKWGRVRGGRSLLEYHLRTEGVVQ